MEKLKPCPFCGSESVSIMYNHQAGECAVNCNATRGGCGATSGYAPRREAAIKAWNRRVKDECITERTIRMNIVNEIIQERNRQVTDKGYSLQHDDELDEGQLAEAGSVYASTRVGDRAENYPYGWVFKPTERRWELIKAAALIVAEIERLDRRVKDERNQIQA